MRELMREKLSSNAYHFDVEQSTRSDGGVLITVTLHQMETGKTKVFTQHSGSVLGFVNHMNSLTDDLCSQWFNERQKKTKKEKVVEPT